MKKGGKQSGRKNKKIKELSAKAKRVFAESDVLVILEDMNDNIKIIAEGQLGLREELHSFKEEMHEFKEEMHEFKDEMYEFRSLVLEDLDEIKGRLGKMEDDIAEIKERLANKADKKEVETRLVFLEKEIALIKQSLAIN